MQKKISRLISGGLMTNYYCTSECGHCLYGCSPRWEKRYLDHRTAEMNLLKIRGMGCFSLHIGGGEPFLNPDGLIETVRVFNQLQLRIDYIETNSSWFINRDQADRLLHHLLDLGVSTLLISISPFHNAYIPFCKVEEVMAACKRTGMQVFPWTTGMLPDLRAFDPQKTHTLDEFSEKWGPDYVTSIPERYWVTMRGRALETYRIYMPSVNLDRLLQQNSGPCRELLDTSHFHVDLFGNYIPGLCSGLAIRIQDLGRSLDKAQYPLLNRLLDQGIIGLLSLAREKYGFLPVKQYVSKCDLCFQIRRFLVLEKKLNSIELQPGEFYLRV